MGFFGKKSESISNTEPRINALKYEQSTYGATKAVLYGTNKLCGNVIDVIDFAATPHTTTTRMGKGGGQTSSNTTYTYTARTAIGLCEGQIGNIRNVLLDKGKHTLSDKKMNFFNGASNQSAWGEMATLHPDHALCYKNLAYVAGNLDLTSNGSIPQYNFEINGKFTNNTDDLTPVITEGFSFSAEDGTLGIVNATIDYSEYFVSISKIELVYFDANSKQYTNGNFTNFTISVADNKQVVTLNLSGLGATSAHAYITFNSTVRLDANPKDIILDVLTNQVYGVGLPLSYIDTESLINFSNYCIANNIFISPLYDKQQEAQQVLTDIANISNSTFIWSQGKLKLIPLGDESVTDNGKTFTPNLTPVYDLTEDDFICEADEEPISCIRKSLNDVKNSVKIEYLNRANNYSTEIEEAQDLADIELYGLKQADVLTAHQICTQEVAQKVAAIALQRNIAARNTFTFKLPLYYILLEPGDLVTLTHLRLNLRRKLVRILSVNVRDEVLEVEAEEMVIGTASAAKYPTQKTSVEGVDTSKSVGDINTPIIFEPPFKLTQNQLEVWIGISSSKNLFGGAEIWISEDNETYKYLGELRKTVRQGILTAALPDIETEIDNVNTLAIDVSMSKAEILSGTENDMQHLNTLCYVDGELLAYQNATLVDDYEYNLTNLKRGAYYTTPHAHVANTQFCRIDNDCFLRVPFIEDDIGKKIYVKICTFNTFNGGLQNLAQVQAHEYLILGNASDIYPEDVTNFNVVQSQNFFSFMWSYTKNRNDTYEIRYGESWATGQEVGKGIEVNTFTWKIPNTGLYKFWIKAYNKYNHSENATLDVIDVDSIPEVNTIVSFDILDDMQGTFTNTYKYHHSLKLNVDNVKWHNTQNKWGEDDYYQINGIWGAKVVSQGSYISQIYDIESVFTSIIGFEQGYLTADSEQDILLEWRHSKDNINWSEWLLCNNGEHTFRYCQFRATLRAYNNIPIVLNTFRVSVDVPDKEIELELDIPSDSDGMAISYDFISVPSIIGTVNDDIGAYVVVTEKTNTRALIKAFKNDGSTTGAKVNLRLKGY